MAGASAVKCQACGNELSFTVLATRTALLTRSRRNANFRITEIREEGARPLQCGTCGSRSITLAGSSWESLVTLIFKAKGDLTETSKETTERAKAMTPSPETDRVTEEQ